MKTSILAASLLFTLLGVPANAAIRHVDDSNRTGIEKGTLKQPFKSIQAAIVAATNGDTIKVALGEYGPITTLGKSLTLLGGYPGTSASNYANGAAGDFSAQGPALSATIISGGQNKNGVTFTRFNSDPYQATLDNFTIRDSRKGVVCDIEVSFPHATNVTISRNRVENNGAPNNDSFGGGVLITGSNISILGNTIQGNSGGRGAGIVRLAGDGIVRIKNNRILNNTGYDHGGGIHIYGNVLLTGNIIAGNRVNFEYGWGGGMIMHSSGTLKSSNNIFRDNHSPTYGGGLFVDDGASAILRNDLVHHNTTATGYGGGIAVDDGAPGATDIEMSNCTVVYNNIGGAVPEFGDLGGNGLFLDYFQGGTKGSTATVANCIFWGNGEGDDFAQAGPLAVLKMTYSTSQEAFPGNRNRTDNPRFTDVAGDDYTLRNGSTCIGSGINQPWMTGAKDLAGNPRIVNGTVDRGSYEKP